jgi:DNA-binding NtrC family response regulator
MSSDLPWPGNVRQLESAMARARERALADDPAASLLSTEHLTPRDLGVRLLAVPPPRAVPQAQTALCSSFQIEPGELADSWARLSHERAELDRIERDIIEAALARTDHVVARAARELGVGRTSLISRCDTLGIGKSLRPARG